MVVCTLCPLMIPLLALSGVTGIHPVRAPAGAAAVIMLVATAGSTDARPRDANAFRIAWGRDPVPAR
jgi:hypothetical protein